MPLQRTLLLALGALALALAAHDRGEDMFNRVEVFVTNKTPHVFTFAVLSGANPGNTWLLDGAPATAPPNKTAPVVLRPGGTLNVTGTSSSREDLFALVTFDLTDMPPPTNVTVWILDPQQFHIVQPIFSVDINDLVQSNSSLTRNPVIEPLAVLVIEANITIFPR
jgi:hypothetical protein